MTDKTTTGSDAVDLDKMRAEFEAWAVKAAPKHGIERNERGEYVDYPTHCAWVGYRTALTTQARAAAPAAIPEGFVLVPTDPPLKMAKAFRDADVKGDRFIDGYRAMLAAAPTATAEPVTWKGSLAQVVMDVPLPERNDKYQSGFVDAKAAILKALRDAGFDRAPAQQQAAPLTDARALEIAAEQDYGDEDPKCILRLLRAAISTVNRVTPEMWMQLGASQERLRASSERVGALKAKYGIDSCRATGTDRAQAGEAPAGAKEEGKEG